MNGGTRAGFSGKAALSSTEGALPRELPRDIYRGRASKKERRKCRAMLVRETGFPGPYEGGKLSHRQECGSGPRNFPGIGRGAAPGIDGFAERRFKRRPELNEGPCPSKVWTKVAQARGDLGHPVYRPAGKAIGQFARGFWPARGESEFRVGNGF